MTIWSDHNGFRREWRRWLGASGSLSARLVGHGASFTVQVLRQGMQPLRLEEARALGLSGPQAGYVREVVLSVDGAPVIFARTVTTQAHAMGPWRAIRGLGTRPLADLLFKRSGIRRTPLAFARLPRHQVARADVTRDWLRVSGQPRPQGVLPARRSVFSRNGAPLMVTEVFAAPHAPWCWPSPRRISPSPVLPRRWA